MAGYGWGSGHPVKGWLFDEGHRFGFFQAVRLLEMLEPECVPLGEGTNVAKEAVRFRSSPSLGFPASEVHEVQNPDAPRMTVNFLGLTGAHGPMPMPYTERVLRRLQAGDPTMRDFLDIFNHRMVSMVYRIRRKHRVGLETSPPDKQGFAWYLFALMGLGNEGLRGRLKIPDRALLRYTGLLCRYPRSTSVLCVILKDFFAVPVRDHQHRGAFRTLDEDQWTAIGETGRNQGLGLGAVLGTSLWDQHAGVELELGPMGWERYCDFLPDNPGFVALCQFVRFYLGPLFDFSLRLRLQANEVIATRLSSDGDARLGWTSWLGLPPPGTVVDVPIAQIHHFHDAPGRVVPEEPEPDVEPSDGAAEALSALEPEPAEADLPVIDDFADVDADAVEFEREDTNPNWQLP